MWKDDQVSQPGVQYCEAQSSAEESDFTTKLLRLKSSVHLICQSIGKLMAAAGAAEETS